jgi:hypothetical protein
MTDKNGIVIVSDPTFRRQTETRFRIIPDQLPVEIGEVVVAAIDEPVRDLTYAPVAAMFDFYLVNLNNNKNRISKLSCNVKHLNRCKEIKPERSIKDEKRHTKNETVVYLVFKFSTLKKHYKS